MTTDNTQCTVGKTTFFQGELGQNLCRPRRTDRLPKGPT